MSSARPIPHGRRCRRRCWTEDTRYPFVINMPQHHLEPILRDAIDRRRPGALHLRHRLTSFRQSNDGVVASFETPDGGRDVEGSYLLACDGGRSTVRAQLGVPVEGELSDVRCLLVDVKVDLDVANPRDYPYLAYFADPQEWMILVRQPHCWRFLYPLGPGVPEPGADEFRDKVIRFIGPVDQMEILNTIVYRIHHRVATQWRSDRVFLMGDAAHLITPMWALGLNTGILDAISLPWRVAWVARGWAERCPARWLCARAAAGRRRRLRRDGGSRAQIHGGTGGAGEGDVGHGMGQRRDPNHAGGAPWRR